MGSVDYLLANSTNWRDNTHDGISLVVRGLYCKAGGLRIGSRGRINTHGLTKT